MRVLSATYKAPQTPKISLSSISIFLAGSIEVGAAELWQPKLTEALHRKYSNIVVLDPRRDSFDWTQGNSLDSPLFHEQVHWEITNIQNADCIFIYFDPNTKSPISLLELGMVSQLAKPVIVCCPNGFWRKGNVDYMCKTFGMHMVNNYLDLLDVLPEYFEHKIKRY